MVLIFIVCLFWGLWIVEMFFHFFSILFTYEIHTLFFSYSFFFCEINFAEFLKEALIWLDWFSNLRAHSSVISCSNFLTYLPLLSPAITWTPLFLPLCYLCHTKFGFHFQKLLPGGPALEASLSRSISGLLRMSPLLQTSLLQALALTYIWSMPKLPPPVSVLVVTVLQGFPFSCPVCGSTACFYFPSTGSLFIHTQTHLCLCIY